MENDFAVIWAATASAGARFLLVVAILGLASWFILKFSKNAFGFDIKTGLNHVEDQARKGNVWPLVSILLGGMAAFAFIARGLLS